MARAALEVTTSIIDDTLLTDALAPGALQLIDLRSRDQLQVAARAVRIRRQGGYCGFDIWLWLMFFFCAGVRISLKSFWLKHVRPHRAQLASLVGRARLPAASSLSRALDAAEHEHVRAAIPVLLCQITGVDEMLEHPALCTYDAHAKPWQVFDLDPTVTTLRHRALPSGPELPEPARLAEHMGAPGYSGRKRGDLQFRRVTVQHAGSGAWLHMHLSQGNGEGSTDLALALDAIVACCQRTQQPVERALVRLDGEYGNVPAITECQQRQLAFVTRLNRLHLLDDPQVLQTLRRARFFVVPDSASGPVRSACELGVFTIEPGERTRRPDGTRYEPVKVRVVAAVMARPDGKVRNGRLIDGYQVELFATALPADAWPCHEVVASFFGRAGQENRFAQEDREFGLDRIFSYQLAGQELCTAVALSVWNLRLARGFAMAPPPEAAPEQARTIAQLDASMPRGWPREPGLLQTLDVLDWEQLLAQHPGWRYDAVAHHVLCPADRALLLSSVRQRTNGAGHSGVIFRRPRGGCDECALRATCLSSPHADASKHLEVSVSAPLAALLWTNLATQRAQLPKPSQVHIEPAVAIAVGHRAVLDARFLPAKARQLFMGALDRARLRVEVATPTVEPPASSLMAASVAERQRRRQTWSQKLAQNELDEAIRPKVHIEGSALLHRAVEIKPFLLSS